ncbi:MAG: hypothetical protein AAGG38_07225 [Planctomycetota bacterium]
MIAAGPTVSTLNDGSAKQRVRVLLNNHDPIEIIIALAKELAKFHEQPRPRQPQSHQTPRQMFDEFKPDPTANGWAVEAVANSLLAMSDPPTPADLGRVARHLHHPPPRCKFPVTIREIVAACHRLREKLSGEQIGAVLDHIEALAFSPIK